MATSSLKQFAVLLPRSIRPAGTAQTPTFNPNSTTQTLTLPTYREHLVDLFDTRIASDSRALIQQLFVNDPDMSAAVHSFLTVADTEPIFLVKDANGQLDRAGQKILNSLIQSFTQRFDYSKGFKIVQSLSALTESCRYMLLLRGALGGEIVLTKEYFPAELRLVDMRSVSWYETQPGKFVPEQESADGKKISLDIPTFLTTWFRKDPTAIYSNSPFVSAINTIAARQQVINDLYRIMRITGYPRMDVKVMEEVALKGATPDVLADPIKKATFLRNKLSEITSLITTIRPDQAFVHFDSVEPKILNEKSAASTLDITSVIETLNAQNQAGLRTMATILGRGTSGVNTASVESRVFSMSAQALNQPVADFLSQALTLALRFQGSQSYVHVMFAPVELRPDTELEPMLAAKASRLREDLSLGILTDDEYHLEMYGRMRPDSAPELSGTGFMNKGSGQEGLEISPNSDPLGRSLAPKGGKKRCVTTKLVNNKPFDAPEITHYHPRHYEQTC